MLVRASSKEVNSKIKKFLYTSIGFIYGAAFGTIVFPIRGFFHEIRRTVLQEISLKAAISTIHVTAKLFLEGKMIGDRTAEAFSNKGWKAWRSPNRLITIYLSHPDHNPLDHLHDGAYHPDPWHLAKINDITNFSNDEKIDNCSKKAVNDAINTTQFIKTCIDDSLKQKPNQKCKSFPIETSALIMQYLGAEVPGIPDEIIADNIRQHLNRHIYKSHLANKGLIHRFFSCFKLYKRNAEHTKALPLLPLEKKEENNSTTSTYTP